MSAAKNCYEKELGSCIDCDHYGFDRAHAMKNGVLYINCLLVKESVPACQEDNNKKCQYFLSVFEPENDIKNLLQPNQHQGQQEKITLGINVTVLC